MNKCTICQYEGEDFYYSNGSWDEGAIMRPGYDMSWRRHFVICPKCNIVMAKFPADAEFFKSKPKEKH